MILILVSNTKLGEIQIYEMRHFDCKCQIVQLIFARTLVAWWLTRSRQNINFVTVQVWLALDIMWPFSRIHTRDNRNTDIVSVRFFNNIWHPRLEHLICRLEHNFIIRLSICKYLVNKLIHILCLHSHASLSLLLFMHAHIINSIYFILILFIFCRDLTTWLYMFRL